MAHKQLEAKDGFMMVGAYPRGAPHWDMLEGKGGDAEWREAATSIKGVRIPAQDPLLGSDPEAPMFKHWSHAAS